MNRANAMFPPLGETSFSEQYKTFKALGGKKNPLNGTLEMSKDLQMRIRPAGLNKPFYKRSFKGPSFEQDASFGMMVGQGGVYANMVPTGVDQSVFQTNASHVLSSPNTFNMMADATTAPYPLENSMMRNLMSPNGK